jgi:hypothetical protein
MAEPGGPTGPARFVPRGAAWAQRGHQRGQSPQPTHSPRAAHTGSTHPTQPSTTPRSSLKGAGDVNVATPLNQLATTEAV